MIELTDGFCKKISSMIAFSLTATLFAQNNLAHLERNRTSISTGMMVT